MEEWVGHRPPWRAYRFINILLSRLKRSSLVSSSTYVITPRDITPDTTLLVGHSAVFD